MCVQQLLVRALLGVSVVASTGVPLFAAPVGDPPSGATLLPGASGFAPQVAAEYPDPQVSGTTTAYAFAIDLHGDFMVVGDPDGDFGPPNAHHNTGAAYVYRRDAAGAWVLEQTLLPDVLGGETHHEFEGDEFGDAVAIWGDTVVIGAPGEDSANAGVDADPNDDGAEQAGAAYVFVRGSDGQWQQQAYLKAFNPDAWDAFGRSVAIHADRIAVGADGEASVSTTESPDPDDNGLGLAGAVYVFDRSGTTWTQTGYLKPFNVNVTAPFVGDRMGGSVAVWGDTVIAGAAEEDSETTGVNGPGDVNAQPQSGAAYVFVQDGAGDWSQQAYIKPSNTKYSANFGSSVALVGDLAVVGSESEGGASSGIGGAQKQFPLGPSAGSGAAYVFRRTGATWEQEAYIKASNAEGGDRFGARVALAHDGGSLCIIAIFEDSADDEMNGNLTHSGAAYLFRYEEGAWRQVQFLKGLAGEFSQANMLFGFALGGDGARWALGAPFHSPSLGSSRGAAFVFEDLGAFGSEGASLAGANGAPRLVADGTLLPESVNLYTLSDAAPSATAGVFVAVESMPVTFKTGTLKAFPFAKLKLLSTGADGGFVLPLTLPSTPLPGGLELWTQVAVLDSGAPAGVALSNAVLGVTP